MKRILATLAALLAGAVTLDARADAPALLREGHLACGGASLSASTRFLDVADHDRQVVSQFIAIVPPAAATPVSLVLDARPLRQPFLRGTPVLDASATGWACVTATSGRAYVYVMMTCTESPSRPACAGDTREWVRLYDLRGRALNAGFPHDGPRTPALLKRLGLAGAVADGVSLADIAE